MDPNQALKEIREAVKGMNDGSACCAEHGEMSGQHLAELIDGLDEWLTGGGFYPADWEALRGRHLR